jgi:hypothetical protein
MEFGGLVKTIGPKKQDFDQKHSPDCDGMFWGREQMLFRASTPGSANVLHEVSP